MMKAIGLGLVLAAAMAASQAQAADATLRGVVTSGGGKERAAIAGAEVTIYQAGPRGGRPLAGAVSDAQGRFETRLAPDPDGGVVYAVARKGAAVELMSVLGHQVPDRIVIDEMTTVASAYAMARLFDGELHIPARPRLPADVAAGMARNLVAPETGMPSAVMTSSPNADETNAWRLLGTLSNLLAPCVRGAEESCKRLFRLTDSTDGGKPRTTLQAMVAVARHPAAKLRPLFDLAQAMPVYAPALVDPRQGPDAHDEQMRLDAFTLAIKFNATGRTDPKTGEEVCPFGGPANVAFDLNGDLWITNNVVQGGTGSALCMVVLKPDGSPESFSPVMGGGVVGQGFGLGFAPDGTVWSGNFGWGGVDPVDQAGNPGGSVSHFTRAGRALSPDWGFTGDLFKVQGTVSDREGNIWLASFGNDRVQVFPHGDASAAAPGWHDAGEGPFDIRLDAEGSAWVSYNATATLSKMKLTPDGPRPLFTIQAGSLPTSGGNGHITGGPKGVAVTPDGGVWMAHGDDNAVYAFDAEGTQIGRFSGGGMEGPWGVSLDAGGMLWVADFGPLGPWTGKPRITELCGAAHCAGGLSRGDAVSPSTGWTLPSGGDEVRLHDGQPLYAPLKAKSFKPLERVTSVNADAAGNLWAANNWKPSWVIDLVKNPGGDAMVVFVGLAAPTAPVLYSAPARSPFAGE